MKQPHLPEPTIFMEYFHPFAKSHLGGHFAHHICKAPHGHHRQPADGKG
jgi:hypothetical protein